MPKKELVYMCFEKACIPSLYYTSLPHHIKSGKASQERVSTHSPMHRFTLAFVLQAPLIPSATQHTNTQTQTRKSERKANKTQGHNKCRHSFSSCVSPLVSLNPPLFFFFLSKTLLAFCSLLHALGKPYYI